MANFGLIQPTNSGEISLVIIEPPHGYQRVPLSLAQYAAWASAGYVVEKVDPTDYQSITVAPASEGTAPDVVQVEPAS